MRCGQQWQLGQVLMPSPPRSAQVNPAHPLSPTPPPRFHTKCAQPGSGEYRKLLTISLVFSGWTSIVSICGGPRESAQGRCMQVAVEAPALQDACTCLTGACMRELFLFHLATPACCTPTATKTTAAPTTLHCSRSFSSSAWMNGYATF